MSQNEQIDNQEERGYPKIVDTRLRQLYYAIEDSKSEALVITHVPHVRYLTNFSGSSATLFVTEDELHFVTDDRYEEQIKDELYPLPNLKTHISRDPWELISENKILKNITTIAFEADQLYYSDAILIRNQIRPVKFKPVAKMVEPFTIPKSPEELANIEKAAEIAVQVYDKILTIIKPGMTEKEIDTEIAYQSRKLGSENDPFDIIVVSGPRSALVHGTASDRKLKNGDIVLMDFGCKVNGFMSDITRTIALGKATKEQKSIYKLCFEAKEAAIQGVRPTMNGKNLDAIARRMIEKEGFGDYFQHSLGHGIGLAAHELPIITFRKDDQVVVENCVLAIEPGVYLPNKFGIRVEDMCHVTRNGGRHLTKAPDELLIV